MSHVAEDAEVHAARLQLFELQARLQCISDAKVALGLFFQDQGQQADLNAHQHGSNGQEEEQLLQEQAAALKSYIASLESQHAAGRLLQREENGFRASLQTAQALSARDNWDAVVGRHDRQLAMEVDMCSSEEWDNWGDHLNRPLMMPTPRPASPECAIVLVSEEESEGTSEAAAAAQGATPALFSAEHKYPVCCPNPSCQEELQHSDLVALLQGSTPVLQSISATVLHHQRDGLEMLRTLFMIAVLQLLERLVLESSIEQSLRAYCPYKDCSCLLERDEEDLDEEGQLPQGQDAPYKCPACNRVFCLACGITGWHQGMTCSQFQALPMELKSVEDAAMLRMAAAQSWKRCPSAGCGHVVERIDGCNHMLCRCGVDFCYACGKPYKNNVPNADNLHGTAGCDCPLFDVPEEVEDQGHVAAGVAVMEPVVLRRAEGLRPRIWRNGRQRKCQLAAGGGVPPTLLGLSKAGLNEISQRALSDSSAWLLLEPPTHRQSAQQISTQMSVLNNAMNRYGFEFRLAGSWQYPVSQSQFTTSPGTADEQAMKASSRRGTFADLNIWTWQIGGNTLGFATYPFGR
eukprot:gene12513-12647_t